VQTHAVVQTPVGGLGVRVDAGDVIGVSFGAAATPGSGATDADPALSLAVAELIAYFAGELTDFTVPVRFAYGSAFERAVWAQIASIPYGQTRTYGQIARAVGEPGGAQAVGAACGRNPVPVVVPCHRVVAAAGKLGGFGGGLPRKRRLLQLEARVAIEHCLDTLVGG
jgi:methylated-DNA-[protein]-cysteine S-methyltransferase